MRPAIYTEPMETAEVVFLQKKVNREIKNYYKALWVMMILSFVLPYAGAWYRVTEDSEDAFSKIKFFSSAAVLLALSCGALYTAYRYNLRSIRKDVKTRTKTVERTHITRKQYMPQNNTYFFYLDSPNKLSVEVSQNDYHNMQQGDELNIEYATYSKLYLGYF